MEKNLNQQGKAPKKPSYEELNGYVNELMMENRNLRQRLGQIMNVQNKIPWLFEIIKNKEFFDSEYIQATVREIQLILPPYNEEEDKKSAEKNKESNKD